MTVQTCVLCGTHARKMRSALNVTSGERSWFCLDRTACAESAHRRDEAAALDREYAKRYASATERALDLLYGTN